MLFQIEHNFYDEALKKALEEDTPEKREAFRQMIYEYSKMREDMDLDPTPPNKLNPSSLKWFMGLSGAAVEFARELELNLFMTVNDGPQGYIRFETCSFALDFNSPLLKAFWSLLTEKAHQIEITHYNEKFRIEMLFNLF